MGRSGIFWTEAAPKEEFSDRFLHTGSVLQSQLLLKNLCYCRGACSEEASSRHSRERGTTLVLGGHDLCLSLKPKWHSKFQNIKGIQITSFTSNKTVVKLSLQALNSACNYKILAWQTWTILRWSFFLPGHWLWSWQHGFTAEKYLNASQS